MNKKGFVVELLAIVVVGFIALVFFALWVYGINFLNTELTSVVSENNITNISYATEQTFGYYNVGVSKLGMVGLMIMIGFIAAAFITGYYSRDHPVLLIVYFMFVVIAIVFSIYVSNAYETLMSNDVIGTTLTGFTAGSYIMLHLPYWMTVVGVIGMILAIAGRYLGMGGGY